MHLQCSDHNLEFNVKSRRKNTFEPDGGGGWLPGQMQGEEGPQTSWLKNIDAKNILAVVYYWLKK